MHELLIFGSKDTQQLSLFIYLHTLPSLRGGFSSWVGDQNSDPIPAVTSIQSNFSFTLNFCNFCWFLHKGQSSACSSPCVGLGRVCLKL
jgi:hypothetical protein